MAEVFLTLMADLDDESQQILSGWYRKLQDAGFFGVQTPNLPFHIRIAGSDQRDFLFGRIVRLERY